MKAVELKNVTFTYDGAETPVLSGVNFLCEHGEVTLLSGLSGEGKSTVLSLICGIIPNVTPGTLSGEVFIDGENIAGYKMSRVCRKVGVVLQNADLQIIQKIVEDEIAFGCENFAFPPEKISAQIARVCKIMKLQPEWRTRSLSGGQKQRLITASALATGQKILVLDEPLANLDNEGAKLLMTTLRALARAGYAVLVVEHRLDIVLPYVDRVWSIGGGMIAPIEDKKQYLISQSRLIGDNCAPYAKKQDILSVENIAFEAGKRNILRGVSFRVSRGERILLLGENGCGKTTLLRIIARLLKPTGGKVVQYIDPSLKQKTRGGKAWFKRVGVVYQNPDYQLFMPTVQKEVEFNAKTPEYAATIMQMFGIDHLAARHPQSLSEGQKRRVSIAAVAAGDPEILLLDEPTVGQDYAGLKELVRILDKLHEESGNTMITVTHDMRCAEALCDRTIILGGGKVLEEGGKELAHSYFLSEK